MPRNRLLKSVAICAAMTSVSAATAEDWPELPVGIKNGIGVQIGHQLFVGLGSAGTDLYALDLENPQNGWEKRSSFPGPAPSQPAAAASNGKLFVFGGSGKLSDIDVAPIIFETVYEYSATDDEWSTVETSTPVGLLGASALSLSDGRIAIVGGYNKNLFDRYLAEVLSIDKDKNPDQWNSVVNAYMGMPPEDYLWNKNVLVYEPSTNNWQNLGESPFPPNTGSAVVTLSPDDFLIINGEIKPGLRTDVVKSLSINGTDAIWTEKAALPAPADMKIQEGLAGGYAGLSGAAVIVTGGANFPGARAKADSGQWYAHEGLNKHRAAEIFVLTDGDWIQSGELAEGLAYGASFTVDNGLLVVGGEDNAGAARQDVFLLRWNGQSVTRTD